MAILFVGANTGATSNVVFPAHVSGDLLIAVAQKHANTATAVINTAFTAVGNVTVGTNIANDQNYIVGFKIATATNDVSGIWTNANGMLGFVYRAGTGNTISVGNSAFTNGTANTTFKYPGIGLVAPSNSIVLTIASAFTNTAGIAANATGQFLRSSIALPGGILAGHDSNTTVSSFANLAQSITGTPTSWVSGSIEVIETAPITLPSAIVQHARVDNATESTSVSLTLTSPVTNGNMLVIYGHTENDAQTITDDKSNTSYISLDSVIDTTDGCRGATWVLENITHSPQTITLNYPSGSAVNSLRVIEVYGYTLDAHTGKFVTSIGTGANAITSGNVVATSLDLVIGFAADDNSGTGATTTAGTGFAQFDANSASGGTVVCEARVLTTAGNTAATFTASLTNNDWMAHVVALKPVYTVSLDALGIGQGTANATNNVASFNYTGLTVGNGINRALTAVVTINGPATSVSTSNVVATWDSTGANQVMTLLTSVVENTEKATLYIFGLRNPVSGNKTLNVSWAGNNFIAMEAISYSGVDVTSDNTAFSYSNTNPAGTNRAVNIVIPSTQYSRVVSGLITEAFAPTGNTVNMTFNSASGYNTQSGGVYTEADNIQVLESLGGLPSKTQGFTTPATNTAFSMAAATLSPATANTPVLVFDQRSQMATGTSDGGNGGFNSREVFNANVFASANGCNQVRITLQFGSGSNTYANGVTSFWFGQANTPSGYGFTGTQVQVTFGGSNVISSAPNKVVVSDWITLGETYDSTKSYVASWYAPTTSANIAYSEITVTGTQVYYTSSGDFSSNTSPPTGYSTDGTGSCTFVAGIEVRPPSFVALDKTGTVVYGTGVTTVSDSTSLTLGTGLASTALFATLSLTYTGSAPTGVGLTWNSVAMVQCGSYTNSANSPSIVNYIYWLKNPATGNHTLTASWTNVANDAYLCGISFYGVDQITGYDGVVTNTGLSNTGTISIASNTSNYTLANWNLAGGQHITGQSDNLLFFNNSGTDNAGATYGVGASPTKTQTVTLDLARTWNVLALNIRAVGSAVSATFGYLYNKISRNSLLRR